MYKRAISQVNLISFLLLVDPLNFFHQLVININSCCLTTSEIVCLVAEKFYLLLYRQNNFQNFMKCVKVYILGVVRDSLKLNRFGCHSNDHPYVFYCHIFYGEQLIDNLLVPVPPKRTATCIVLGNYGGVCEQCSPCFNGSEKSGLQLLKVCTICFNTIAVSFLGSLLSATMYKQAVSDILSKLL